MLVRIVVGRVSVSRRSSTKLTSCILALIIRCPFPSASRGSCLGRVRAVPNHDVGDEDENGHCQGDGYPPVDLGDGEKVRVSQRTAHKKKREKDPIPKLGDDCSPVEPLAERTFIPIHSSLRGEEELLLDSEELLLLAADEVVSALLKPKPEPAPAPTELEPEDEEGDDPELVPAPELAPWVDSTVPEPLAAVMVVIDVLLVVPVASGATGRALVSSVESLRAQRVALGETVPVEPISKRTL